MQSATKQFHSYLQIVIRVTGVPSYPFLCIRKRKETVLKFNPVQIQLQFFSSKNSNKKVKGLIIYNMFIDELRVLRN